ncbi:ethyl tert-butyl ether degradation protein EthD [Rhodoplanes elegans]|uniref:Ethyl tert-butyl ether degradation protein EthD n=1 Tax=Rhodoplanes elegans TaxID=29408 RepID=A0A327KS77_9BRAD|nr:EthD family reductase [Rhodoplanes elegans]MBK5957322.1 ethyl tert-butyl ether degradation protein EthD [Rhodoplanes elegans]RAI41709.1 ethyl tert-butyl ether degradation protein EthD [Rhodoplanes elegans]
MIHQFIFASPKPGMTEAAFQRYWVEEHAVRYASRIAQIRKYKVDTRVARPGDSAEPLWSGVAEIWLANETEQLASLQSPEFIDGARADEPRWAAFWRTLALDTTAHLLLPGPAEARDTTLALLLVLTKRREGLPLGDFRSHMLGTHAALAAALPGLRRYQQGHVRDGAYAIGEAPLDCVEQLWFDDRDAALAAETSIEGAMLASDWRRCAEPRFLHRLVVREHWIIGPEPRS